MHHPPPALRSASSNKANRRVRVRIQEPDVVIAATPSPPLPPSRPSPARVDLDAEPTDDETPPTLPVLDMFVRTLAAPFSDGNAFSTTVARIGSFWGLATLPAVGAMAESNAHEGGHKLRQIDCHTRSMLLALFRPWNDMLYEDLGRDAAAHAAPDVEPRRFRPFDATVGCTDRKVTECAWVARGVIRARFLINVDDIE